MDGDLAASYLYDTSEPIADSLLPPVFYAKRDNKRIKLTSSSISPGKKSIVTTPPSSSGGLLTTVKTSPMASLGVLTTTTNLLLPSSGVSLGGLTPPSSSASSSLVPMLQTSGGSSTSASKTSSSSTTAKVDANIVQTRPLFDKPNATLVKLRRDVKMQKMKGWPTYKMDLIRSTLPVPHELSFGIDDWLPNDDFIILYV